MKISLTPHQERLIQSKLQTGKYHSVEEILEIALRLLDQYDLAETQWDKDVRGKIDAAISQAEEMEPLDGETFINQILERFKQVHQNQE